MVFDDDDDDDKLWFHNCVGFKRKTNLLCVFLCMFQFFLRLYVAVGVGGVGWGGVGWGGAIKLMLCVLVTLHIYALLLMLHNGFSHVFFDTFLVLCYGLSQVTLDTFLMLHYRFSKEFFEWFVMLRYSYRVWNGRVLNGRFWKIHMS